jgi:hypothetical protein
MDTITIPAPDQIRQRIASCEEELRSLRRLLRLSLTAKQADDARQQRASLTRQQEGADASSR